MSDEIEVSGSADFSAVDSAFETTASNAKTNLQALADAFDASTGQSGASLQKLKQALADTQALITTAVATSKEQLQALADSYQQQISQLGGLSSSTDAYASSQGNLSVVTTMTGASFGAYARYLAGIQPTTLSARDSAEAFRAELGALGEQLDLISASGFSQMVGELAGVRTSFLSAEASAAAFSAELGAVNSRVQTMTGSTFGALVNNLRGTDRSFKDMREDGIQLAQMFGEVEAAGGGVSQGMKGTAGATSGMTRELVVLGHEAMTGNFSRMPGSMMVLAQRIGNVTAATMGMVAGFAAAVYAGSELIGYLDRLKDMRVSTDAAGSLFNPQIPQQALERYVTQLHDMSDVTTEQATKAAMAFASMQGATEPVIQTMINNIQTYAKATGVSIDQAAEKMATAWSNPATKGAEFLESMGANSDAVAKFDNMVTASDGVIQQRRDILSTLVAQTNQVRAATQGATEDQHKFATEFQLAIAGSTGGAAAYQNMQELQRAQALEQSAQKAKDLADALASVNSQIKQTSGGNQWMEQEKAALDQQKAAVMSSATNYKQARETELQTTVDFWSKVLVGGNLSNQQELAAKQQLFTAEEALDGMKLRIGETSAKQGLQEQLKAIDAEQQAAKEDFQSWEVLEAQKLGLIEQNLGKKSTMYQQELKNEEAYQQQHNQKVVQQELQSMSTQETVDRDALAAKKSTLDSEVALHEITKAQEYKLLVDFTNNQEQQELQALNTLISTLQQGTDAYKTALQARDKLQADFTKKLAQYNSEETTSEGSMWSTFKANADKALSSVGSEASSTFAHMAVYGGTWLSVEQEIMEKFIEGALNTFGKLLVKWIDTETTQTAATVAGNAARTASSTAAATTTAAVESATQKQTVLGHAYSAAAAVYDDVSQIPYVGWVLAPPAAAAAFVAVAAFGGGIPSFDVGAYDLPSDTLAMVHKGEMIIPSSIANDMRAGLGGSGGLGSLSMAYSPTINANAAGAGGLTMDHMNRLMRNSHQQMAGYARSIGRNGGLSMPMRAIR